MRSKKINQKLTDSPWVRMKNKFDGNNIDNHPHILLTYTALTFLLIILLSRSMLMVLFALIVIVPIFFMMLPHWKYASYYRDHIYQKRGNNGQQ